MEKDTPIKEKSNIFVKVGAVVLVVALLLVISFAIVSVVPKAISSLASANLSMSSLFASKPALEASLSSSLIKSGDKTTINFSKTGTNTSGYFSVSYSCDTGAKLNYVNGDTSVAMNCASPYPISTSGNSITITGVAPQNSTVVTVPITLSFISNGSASSTLEKQVSLAISNTGASATSSASNAVSTTTKTTTTSSKNTATGNTETGVSDLSIRLIDEGITDPTSGQFISTKNFNAGNTVVIKFEIQNVGTKSTGPWSFTTSEPMTNNADNYRSSGNLQSLLPGYSTGVVTLALSGINPNGGTVTIKTQPQDKTLSVVIPAGIYNYNYNNNYSSGTYSGNSDLGVKITSITPSYSVRAGGTIQAIVQVTNTGSNATGPYTITASLNNINQTFTNLQSIAPNGSTTLTLTFNGVSAQGTGYVTVSGQTQNGYDNNSSNNTSSVAVYVY